MNLMKLVALPSNSTYEHASQEDRNYWYYMQTNQGEIIGDYLLAKTFELKDNSNMGRCLSPRRDISELSHITKLVLWKHFDRMWPNWKNSMACFCAICRMYQHIMKLENRPGASFRAIFNRALELGTLSRRRVYHEAIKYERERNGGRLSPFGLSSFTAAAAIEDVKSIEVSILLFFTL